MFIIICPDHGNIVPTHAQLVKQRGTDDRWRCPVCNYFAQCVEVPDFAVGLPCSSCGKATTVRGSLWDERHRHFFCNVLCVTDYDQLIKDEFAKARTQAHEDGSAARITGINESRTLPPDTPRKPRDRRAEYERRNATRRKRRF